MKKIPLRKCVATNERLPKQELVRVVKNNEGKVFIDLTGKANGRGAYLKKSNEAIDISIKRKCLERALECTIEERIDEELRNLVSE